MLKNQNKEIFNVVLNDLIIKNRLFIYYYY